MIAATFASIAGGLAVIGETQINSGQIDWQLSTRRADRRADRRHALLPRAVRRRVLLPLRLRLGDRAHGALGHRPRRHRARRRARAAGRALGDDPLAPGPGRRDARKRLARRAGAASEPVRRRPPSSGGHPPSRPSSRPGIRAAPSSGATGPLVLDVRNLTKSFGGLVAVHDVSLHVRQGAIHAIIGPNGAGKTTLFNLVTGLIKPDYGYRSFSRARTSPGTAPWRLVKRGMGRSFQQTNLFWELSVARQRHPRRGRRSTGGRRKLYGTHPAEHRRARGCAARPCRPGARSGLAGARELSHGDQRSLEIATALAVESRFLLLDEPTAGMSPAETKSAVELIRKIARDENLTVLFVEHDMEVVFGIADWITVLHYGAVLAEGHAGRDPRQPGRAASLPRRDHRGGGRARMSARQGRHERDAGRSRSRGSTRSTGRAR